MVWSADRYLSFGSWDKLSLPKLFSKIEYFYGEPFAVPAKIGVDDIEQYRHLLEEQMSALYTKAWHRQGKDEH